MGAGVGKGRGGVHDFCMPYYSCSCHYGGSSGPDLTMNDMSSGGVNIYRPSFPKNENTKRKKDTRYHKANHKNIDVKILIILVVAYFHFSVV